MPETAVTEPIAAGAETLAPASGQPKKTKAFNSFQIAQAQFDKVAEYLGLDPATRDLLRYPLRDRHDVDPFVWVHWGERRCRTGLERSS